MTKLLILIGLCSIGCTATPTTHTIEEDFDRLQGCRLELMGYYINEVEALFLREEVPCGFDFFFSKSAGMSFNGPHMACTYRYDAERKEFVSDQEFCWENYEAAQQVRLDSVRSLGTLRELTRETLPFVPLENMEAEVPLVLGNYAVVSSVDSLKRKLVGVKSKGGHEWTFVAFNRGGYGETIPYYLFQCQNRSFLGLIDDAEHASFYVLELEN